MGSKKQIVETQNQGDVISLVRVCVHARVCVVCVLVNSNVNGVRRLWAEVARESQAALNERTRRARTRRARTVPRRVAEGQLLNSGHPNSGKIEQIPVYSEARGQDGEGPPDCGPCVMAEETESVWF